MWALLTKKSRSTRELLSFRKKKNKGAKKQKQSRRSQSSRNLKSESDIDAQKGGKKDRIKISSKERKLKSLSYIDTTSEITRGSNIHQWHCSSCRQTNSGSKTSCIQCSLHRRSKSSIIMESRSNIEDQAKEKNNSSADSRLKKSASVSAFDSHINTLGANSRVALKELLKERQAIQEERRQKNGTTISSISNFRLLPSVSTGSSVYPNNTSAPCYFSGLPTEMMLHIFSFLSGKGLPHVGAVCKCWHELYNEPQLWRWICMKELYIPSPNEWVRSPHWGVDNWKEYYKHFYNKWEMPARNLAITTYCGQSDSDNYKVYEGTYYGLHATVRNIRSVTEVEESRFKQELEDTKSLQSRHIAKVIGICRVDGALCVLMPFYEKGNLLDLLESKTETIGWKFVLNAMDNIVRGLRDLHNYGLVHKNLSPSSFLVDKEWNVYITDYVDMMNPQSNMKLRPDRNYIATCAPEIFKKDAPFSISTDVYSLAVVLWHLVQRCVTGKYAEPYSEFENVAFGFQTMLMCATRDLRPTISPFCPPPLCDIIQQCWDTDPKKRPDLKKVQKEIRSLKKEYSIKSPEWDHKYLAPMEEEKETKKKE